MYGDMNMNSHDKPILECWTT